MRDKLESLRKEVESLEGKVGVAKEQYQQTVADAQVFILPVPRTQTFLSCVQILTEQSMFFLEWIRCIVSTASISSE